MAEPPPLPLYHNPPPPPPTLSPEQTTQTMSLPTFNTKSPTIKRILAEARELQAHPDPTLHATPLDHNLFEWHFTLRGPPSTPYSTGAYHGRIVLPPSYPLRPPSFRFLTPSGRFEVNREICLSISGHHEETWQPAWGIRTALWALRAFMEGDAKGQVGGLDMSREERGRLAEESRGWRCKGCGGGRTNDEILKEEGGEESGKEGKEEEKVMVPEELRFGFKDQMGRVGDGEGEKKDKGKGKEVVVPPVMSKQPQTQTQKEDGVVISQPKVVKSVEQTVAAPTGPAIALHARPAAPQQATRRTTEGVPAWVDKAITGVAAALAFLILKKILV